MTNSSVWKQIGAIYALLRLLQIAGANARHFGEDAPKQKPANASGARREASLLSQVAALRQKKANTRSLPNPRSPPEPLKAHSVVSSCRRLVAAERKALHRDCEVTDHEPVMNKIRYEICSLQ